MPTLNTNSTDVFLTLGKAPVHNIDSIEKNFQRQNRRNKQLEPPGHLAGEVEGIAVKQRDRVRGMNATGELRPRERGRNSSPEEIPRKGRSRIRDLRTTST